MFNKDDVGSGKVQCVGGLRWLRGRRGEHILLNVFGDRQINRKRGGVPPLFFDENILKYIFGIAPRGLFTVNCFACVIRLVRVRCVSCSCLQCHL